ncbi:MAG: hypothetical protein EBQ94_09145 [Flavobacteriales bacterium]|nr:hypothetical protein [Crocinitomicaceae bacterium]NBX80526.1 hypothetical protein [Flavobacteriales bacterium]
MELVRNSLEIIIGLTLTGFITKNSIQDFFFNQRNHRWLTWTLSSVAIAFGIYVCLSNSIILQFGTGVDLMISQWFFILGAVTIFTGFSYYIGNIYRFFKMQIIR